MPVLFPFPGAFLEVGKEVETDDAVEHAWSFCGFELFDIAVMILQAIIFLASISVDPLFRHPAFQFVIGCSFFLAMYFLSRTRAYARGIQKIESEHQYLGSIIFVGGTVLGVLVLTLYIFRPIKQCLDAFGMDSSWLSIPGVPLSIVALAALPYFSIRAERKDLQNDSQFSSYPIPMIYLGRAVILLLANMILITMHEYFADDNQVIDTINAVFVMSLFYVPVRLQEMFLRPDGPHFQSMFQTLGIMAVANVGVHAFA